MQMWCRFSSSSTPTRDDIDSLIKNEHLFRALGILHGSIDGTKATPVLRRCRILAESECREGRSYGGR